MFEELMEKNCGEIFEYCKYSLGGDVQGAEDCTQEVFFALCKNIHRLKLSEDIRYWLYKTASYKVKNYRRKNKRHSVCSIDDLAEGTLVADDDVQSEYELKEQVQSLTESEKKLVADYYMGKHPEKELGISQNSLRIRVHRIKKKIFDKDD